MKPFIKHRNYWAISNKKNTSFFPFVRMILIRDEAYLQVYLTIGTPFLFMKKEIALVFDIALTTPPSQGRIFDMYIRELFLCIGP